MQPARVYLSTNPTQIVSLIETTPMFVPKQTRNKQTKHRENGILEGILEAARPRKTLGRKIHLEVNAIDESKTFAQKRDRNKVRALFAEIGINLEDAVFDAIYKDATNGFEEGDVSLNAFRGCLNTYLDDVEMGKELEWRYARGVPAGVLESQ